MIVNMMGMEISNYLDIHINRFYSLFFLLILLNCGNKTEAINKENDKINQKTDSLEITIDSIPKKIETGLNYINSDSDAEFISFYNNSDRTQSITKKILKVANNNYSMRFRSFAVINNKTEYFYHDYIINQNINKINFTFNNKNGDIELISSDGNIINYNFIIEAYEKVATKKGKYVNDKIKNTENLFSDFREKLQSKELLSINETIFYNQLAILSPKDKRIEYYLKNIINPIWSFELTGLMYNYIQYNRDQIYTFNLKENENNFFKDLLIKEVLSHLKEYKDKQYPFYNKNLGWFKETDYYNDNATKFKEIFDSEKESNIIRNSLLSFNIYDNNKISNLKTIIANNKSSDYYLLDFWATWCIPCLENIKAMHSMDLPKNLEVVYISMDRTKDKEKWSKKAQNLHLSNSYLFAETEKNKNVIKQVNLNQLPRYVLIDKDFNIINSKLATPQEANFLKELKTYMKD